MMKVSNEMMEKITLCSVMKVSNECIENMGSEGVKLEEYFNKLCRNVIDSMDDGSFDDKLYQFLFWISGNTSFEKMFYTGWGHIVNAMEKKGIVVEKPPRFVTIHH